MFSKLTLVGILAIAVPLAGFLALWTLRDKTPSKEQNASPSVGRKSNALQLEVAGKRIAAPDFALEDSTGRTVHLKDFRGKVVFLNFWATWCPPCVEEMPAMEKLHRQMGGRGHGLAVLAINFQEGPEAVSSFLTRHDFTFTALMDRDGKVAERYRAWALPVSVIIDKWGEIAARAMGARDWAGRETIRFFQELIAEDARA